MQLPDWCFGRRYLVSLFLQSTGGNITFDISEIALSDITVLWNVAYQWYGEALEITWFKLVLGDQIPANVAEFDALEPLIPGFGAQGAEPRTIHCVGLDGQVSIPLRMPIFAQGRRPVLSLVHSGMALRPFQVQLTFSSIPTEVPDWLVSV
jgi:hypothetical protein